MKNKKKVSPFRFFHWNKGLRGKDTSRFKTGKVVCSGYVYVLNHKHPKASKKGYVAEHRLVMEKHIGRYLRAKEAVHHINGIRSDNRIENLMLFACNGKHIRHHKEIRVKACV